MIHVLLQAGAGDKLDIISLISHASSVAKATLVLLLLMSVISWYVIGAKWLYMARAYRRSVAFVEKFWNASLDEMWKEAENAPPSPVVSVLTGWKLKTVMSAQGCPPNFQIRPS